MDAGVAATVFAVVPQRTASESYIAVIRAGSRLSYAARQAAVAADTGSLPLVPLVLAPDAQPDNSSAISNATIAYMVLLLRVRAMNTIRCTSHISVHGGLPIFCSPRGA